MAQPILTDALGVGVCDFFFDYNLNIGADDAIYSFYSHKEPGVGCWLEVNFTTIFTKVVGISNWAVNMV